MSDPRLGRSSERLSDADELERGSRARREADLRMTMSQRLAKLHELCLAVTQIAGSARRR